MSSLFRALRSGETDSKPQGSNYGFQQGGGNHPFRNRPGTTSTTSKPKQSAPSVARAKNGDRPHAYAPPAVSDPGMVTQWEPPGFWEILKDLGLRLLEVSLAAMAYAAGSEIAYFFQPRRFYTEEQRQRGPW